MTTIFKLQNVAITEAKREETDPEPGFSLRESHARKVNDDSNRIIPHADAIELVFKLLSEFDLKIRPDDHPAEFLEAHRSDEATHEITEIDCNKNPLWFVDLLVEKLGYEEALRKLRDHQVEYSVKVARGEKGADASIEEEKRQSRAASDLILLVQALEMKKRLLKVSQPTREEGEFSSHVDESAVEAGEVRSQALDSIKLSREKLESNFKAFSEKKVDVGDKLKTNVLKWLVDCQRKIKKIDEALSQGLSVPDSSKKVLILDRAPYLKMRALRQQAMAQVSMRAAKTCNEDLTSLIDVEYFNLLKQRRSFYHRHLQEKGYLPVFYMPQFEGGLGYACNGFDSWCEDNFWPELKTILKAFFQRFGRNEKLKQINTGLVNAGAFNRSSNSSEQYQCFLRFLLKQGYQDVFVWIDDVYALVLNDLESKAVGEQARLMRHLIESPMVEFDKAGLEGLSYKELRDRMAVEALPEEAEGDAKTEEATPVPPVSLPFTDCFNDSLWDAQKYFIHFLTVQALHDAFFFRNSSDRKKMVDNFFYREKNGVVIDPSPFDKEFGSVLNVCLSGEVVPNETTRVLDDMEALFESDDSDRYLSVEKFKGHVSAGNDLTFSLAGCEIKVSQANLDEFVGSHFNGDTFFIAQALKHQFIKDRFNELNINKFKEEYLRICELDFEDAEKLLEALKANDDFREFKKSLPKKPGETCRTQNERGYSFIAGDKLEDDCCLAAVAEQLEDLKLFTQPYHKSDGAVDPYDPARAGVSPAPAGSVTHDEFDELKRRLADLPVILADRGMQAFNEAVAGIRDKFFSVKISEALAILQDQAPELRPYLLAFSTPLLFDERGHDSDRRMNVGPGDVEAFVSHACGYSDDEQLIVLDDEKHLQGVRFEHLEFVKRWGNRVIGGQKNNLSRKDSFLRRFYSGFVNQCSAVEMLGDLIPFDLVGANKANRMLGERAVHAPTFKLICERSAFVKTAGLIFSKDLPNKLPQHAEDEDTLTLQGWYQCVEAFLKELFETSTYTPVQLFSFLFQEFGKVEVDGEPRNNFSSYKKFFGFLCERLAHANIPGFEGGRLAHVLELLQLMSSFEAEYGYMTLVNPSKEDQKEGATRDAIIAWHAINNYFQEKYQKDSEQGFKQLDALRALLRKHLNSRSGAFSSGRGDHWAGWLVELWKVDQGGIDTSHAKTQLTQLGGKKALDCRKLSLDYHWSFASKHMFIATALSVLAFAFVFSLACIVTVVTHGAGLAGVALLVGKAKMWLTAGAGFLGGSTLGYFAGKKLQHKYCYSIGQDFAQQHVAQKRWARVGAVLGAIAVTVLAVGLSVASHGVLAVPLLKLTLAKWVAISAGAAVATALPLSSRLKKQQYKMPSLARPQEKPLYSPFMYTSNKPDTVRLLAKPLNRHEPMKYCDMTADTFIKTIKANYSAYQEHCAEKGLENVVAEKFERCQMVYDYVKLISELKIRSTAEHGAKLSLLKGIDQASFYALASEIIPSQDQVNRAANSLG